MLLKETEAAGGANRDSSMAERRQADADLRRRRAFVALDFKLCYRCGHDALGTRRLAAGSRCAGGEYGTQFFDCLRCPWSTSFLYDEQGDLFFYETRHWRLESIEDFPGHFMLEWLRRRCFPVGVVEAVRRFDLDGDDLLQLKAAEKLSIKLNIEEQLAASLAAAIPPPLLTVAG